MTFLDIPAAAAVFLDANTFVYHFGPHPVLQRPCQELLERVSRSDIAGFTSAHVLSNVAHRLMTFEAADNFGWPMAGIGYRLGQHPDQVQTLMKFRQSVEEVPNFGVQVLPVELAHVLRATEISQQHGLLSGDALVVAIMQAHGFTSLASHDADFDRVPGLARYAPT
ncbi:MAG: type II toxin-antitoxin system VapC family toxin [Planctomycetes bacterium]|nr:type II toxin-antitoxin system VapC family toxin [Planctomycetota bacterium]